MTAQQPQEDRKESEAPVPVRPRLKERYLAEIAPALMRRFGYRQLMETPRFSKVVVSMGVGAGVQDPKALESAMQDLAIIAGQQPIIRRAKRSIAQFRVREKNPVGCMVTLRGDRMWEFLDRLVSVALPRIRDFRGLPPESVDGRGNYSLGLREQTVFPEINVDKVTRVQGMNITIVTTAKSDENAWPCCGRSGSRCGNPERRRGRPHDEVRGLAKKSLIIKSQRTPKFRARRYNRCKLCGRPRAYYRRFGMCRICFRELASRGLLPGIMKASW